MSPSNVVERVKGVLGRPGITPPPNDVICSKIDVDARFIGEDYAVPSKESIAAIQELARADGGFVGTVYTGKGFADMLAGFAGMLDHLRQEKIPAGANVAFLHTGNAGNLFEVSTVFEVVVDSPLH